MSILMKKPRIEEIADALGDAKKTLLGVLDGPGEYARFDLEKGPLPVGGAPLVRRSILSYKGREYPGVYLRTSLGSHFIEVSGKEECATYEVDEANRNLRKVDEPLTAEELRRVLGGGSGGGSGLPDGYSVDNAGNVTVAGALKANNNGDVEVLNNLMVDGKARLGYVGKCSFNTPFGTPADFFVHEAVFMGEDSQFSNRFVAFWPIVRNEMVDGENTTIIGDLYGFLINNKDGTPATTIDEALNGELDAIPFSISLQGRWQYAEFGELRVYSGKIELSDTGGDEANLRLINTASQAKYQHTVTLHGDGFEFCFTAMSPKNMVIDSYQDLGIVFGGERIGLTGYSAALSAKPVLIDLHGGSVSNDFIRVFEENGSVFDNHTLSSLGAITYTDEVMPK